MTPTQDINPRTRTDVRHTNDLFFSCRLQQEVESTHITHHTQTESTLHVLASGVLRPSNLLYSKRTHPTSPATDKLVCSLFHPSYRRRGLWSALSTAACWRTSRALPSFRFSSQTAMVKLWRAWCPIGWKCGKNNKQLCKRYTRSEALSFLENHLTVSPNHATLSAEERQKLLKTACIWEDENDIPESDDLEEHDEYGDGSGPEGTEVVSATSSRMATSRDPETRTHRGSRSRAGSTRDRSRSRSRRTHHGTIVTRTPSRHSRTRDDTIVARPTAPAPPPPPLHLRVPASNNNAIIRSTVESLRRAETGMAQAAQIAMVASTVLTAEAANVGRAIASLEQYLPRG